MEKNKIIAIIAVALLTLSMTAFWTPNVSAEPQHRIILPFHTSWEDSQYEAIGRTNSVDWKKDFSTPELGWCNNEVNPPSDAFGYEFGSRQLKAAGYFGSSSSHCYFNLFDVTADSDFGPPIKLRSEMFISLWYYHDSLADCMIDAQLYNKETDWYWTLRDFTYDGEYIADQSGVRIHPACRYNDPIGSWQFACFDLSIIYESDPENWYITKIWIAFDNDPSIGDGATGPAKTYFDMLYISYAISNSKTHEFFDLKLWGSVIPYDWYGPDHYGKYHLWVKVVGSAHDGLGCCFSPYQLSVSVDNQVAEVKSTPKPTGINMTNLDSAEGKVTQWLTDCSWALLKKACGLLTVLELAFKFCQILTPPPEEPTYEWPVAVTWGYGHSVHQTYGEVCIELTSLGEENSISVTMNNEYRFYDVEWGGWWHWLDLTLPLNFEWSIEPDELPMSLSISASSSGTTDPDPGTYAYSYGSSVDVNASAYSGYAFDYWLLDGAPKYDNPITVTMNSDHTLKAYFSYTGGCGGCPILSVYDGNEYVEEGLLDIHNPDGTDVVTSHAFIHTPEPVEDRYLMRLTEHPQTHSHIDQVQLFATLENGIEIKLPLVSAVHSADGDVLHELRVSDDVRADTLGADHNNGTSEYINLEFVAPDGLEIETFTFIIEGHNMVLKK